MANRRSINVILFAVSFFLSMAIGFLSGGAVSIKSQASMLSMLLNFSSVVLAVTGIWIALVFPDVMTGVFSKKEVSEKKDLLKRGKKLFVPLVLTSLVAVSSLFLSIALELFGEKVLPGSCFATILSDFIVSVIVFLCFVVSWALLLAVAPGFQIIFDGASHVRNDSYKERVFSLVKRRGKRE